MEDSRKKDIYKCISLGIFIIVLSMFVFFTRRIQTQIDNGELNKNVVITNNSLNTNKTLQKKNNIDYNLINEMELIKKEKRGRYMNEETKRYGKLIIVFVLVIGLLVLVQILIKNKGKKENQIIQNNIQESLIIDMNDNYYNTINTEKELKQYLEKQNNTKYYTLEEYEKMKNKD